MFQKQILFISIFILLFINTTTYAENVNRTFDNRNVTSVDSIPQSNSPLLKQLGVIKQKQDLVHLKVHAKASGNVDFDHYADPQYMDTKFKVNDIRLQVYGKINDWLSYDIRQRLNGSTDALGGDNSSFATDWAYLNFKVGDFTFLAGKLWGFWGGYAMLLNPLDIHYYTDFINASDFFMTGALAMYQYKNNQFIFQVLDSHSGSFNDWYGYTPSDVTHAKAPLTYIMAWYGKSKNQVWETHCSFSVSNEAHNAPMYGLYQGTMMTLPKVQAYVDYYFSYDKIDTHRYLSAILNRNVKNDDDRVIAKDVIYNTMFIKGDYWVTSRWDLMGKYAYEFANYKDNENRPDHLSSRYYQSHSFMVGVEYNLIKYDLRLYTHYVNRFHDYSRGVEEYYNIEDTSVGEFSIGFITHLGVL